MWVTSLFLEKSRHRLGYPLRLGMIQKANIIKFSKKRVFVPILFLSEETIGQDWKQPLAQSGCKQKETQNLLQLQMNNAIAFFLWLYLLFVST